MNFGIDKGKRSIKIAYKHELRFAKRFPFCAGRELIRLSSWIATVRGGKDMFKASCTCKQAGRTHATGTEVRNGASRLVTLARPVRGLSPQENCCFHPKPWLPLRGRNINPGTFLNAGHPHANERP
jgi:hypothetical protein